MHSVLHIRAMLKLSNDLLILASANRSEIFAWRNGLFEAQNKHDLKRLTSSIGWLKNLLRHVTQPNEIYLMDNAMQLILRLELANSTWFGASQFVHCLQQIMSHLLLFLQNKLFQYRTVRFQVWLLPIQNGNL